MTQTAVKINTLLNSNNLSADKVTHPLRDIGDGNMLQGIKTVYKYAYTEGAIKHFVLGGVVSATIIGATYAGYKGIKRIVSTLESRRQHKESGEKIYAAIIKSKSDTPKEEFNEQ